MSITRDGEIIDCPAWMQARSIERVTISGARIGDIGGHLDCVPAPHVPLGWHVRN
jgi:hypothetical protein